MFFHCNPHWQRVGIALVGVCGFGIQATSALPITVANHTLNVIVGDNAGGGFGNDVDVDHTLSIPQSTVVSAALGKASSTSFASFRAVGRGAVFRYRSSQAFDNRNGSLETEFDFANLDVDLVFTVSEDTTYAIAGRFVERGLAFVSTVVGLSDLSRSFDSTLFATVGSAIRATSASVTLGNDCVGFDGCSVTGAVTGTLLAGHRYEFFVGQSIQDLDMGANANRRTAARADESVCLVVGTDARCTVDVAEPASGALMGLGFLTLASRHRGHRRRG